MKKMMLKLKGIQALILHNGRLADPLDMWAKELKRWTLTRKKSDEVHHAISRVEWFGSLYHDGPEDLIEDGKITIDPSCRVIVPARMLEAAFVSGAKKVKMGTEAKSGVIVEEDARLEYTGPKNIVELWGCGKFLFRVSVRNGTNRVMRSRPIFREWSLLTEFSVDPDYLTEKQALDIMQHAGRVGIGDYRPRFGRFEVERV